MTLNDWFDSPSDMRARWKALFWCMRRELWEYRWMLIFALAPAAMVILGCLYTSWVWWDAFDQPPLLILLSFASSMTTQMGMMVALMYSTLSLHTERRDRSMLFWKALPVSDATTVLSKFAFLSLCIPVIHFSALALMYASLYLLGLVASASGPSAALRTWPPAPIANWLLGATHLAISGAVWGAPIYAWFMMIAAWGSRASIALAMASLAAAVAIEGAISDSHRVRDLFLGTLGTNRHNLLQDYWYGPGSENRWPQYIWDSAMTLGNPQVWLGLLVAAALVYATIRIRARNGPI
jgi:ABC-2 type transport system permease protein